MIQYANTIRQEPIEKYIGAFNLLKEKKDAFNKSKSFQAFLESCHSHLRAKIAKILIESNFNIFDANYICQDCFSGIDILKIDIPNNVEIIENYTFYETSLKEIIFDYDNSECYILGFQTLSGTDIEKITLPKNFQHLDGEVFSHCIHLKEVNLNHNIQSIANKVFEDCPSLIFLNYDGTAEEFLNNVDLSSQWKDGSSLQYIKCKDMKIKL